MDVTIVIPTKNAGRLFEKVLKKVFAQETTYEYEVICVDSGSSDNTIEIIKKFPCKLYEIPASEFGHGKDQKLWGLPREQENILFLLHRMQCRHHQKWLQNFIDAMKSDPEIVGGFGIHYP